MPPPGRALPGVPLDRPGADEDDAPQIGGGRFDRPRNHWWRPASAAGRVLLLLVTLTVLGGFAVSAYLLKNYLDRDARFRIAGAGNIETSGLTEVSRSEMLPVFGEDIGRNIFFIPLSERRRQLEQLPWVERATVMRLLPDQIRVSIVERQPVAFALQPNGLTGLVDADGVLLSMPAAMMAQRHYSFPVVTGINASDSLNARRARMAVYQRLLAELDSSGQKISSQISDVDISDPEALRMRMQDDPTLLVIGQEHFLERYQVYTQNIAQWRQLHPDLVSVDLRIEQHAVLAMPVGTNVAQQAAADEQSAAGAGNEQDKPSTANPPEKPLSKAGSKPVNSTGKAGSKSSAKPKSAAKTVIKPAKIKAKDKKRAVAKRAALNQSRQKIAPASRPAASAGMGQ